MSSKNLLVELFVEELPPKALKGERVPAVYFLAGLTCTEETFAMKAGAQRVAIAPDEAPHYGDAWFALRAFGNAGLWGALLAHYTARGVLQALVYPGLVKRSFG